MRGIIEDVLLFIMFLGNANYGVIIVRNLMVYPSSLYKDVFEYAKNSDFQLAAYFLLFISAIVYAILVIANYFPLQVRYE